MSSLIPDEILDGLRSGQVVPYIGPGALADVVNAQDGRPIPAGSDALIDAMTGGRPLSPRLMEEFPRAAMHFELKKGRTFLTNFLTRTYGETEWVGGAVHDWLSALQVPYVIDTNRDLRFQDLWRGRPHTLIAGIARLTASYDRYLAWQYDGETYVEVGGDAIDLSLPVLFKPLGTPRPRPTYIASDADYVDYITELMGGFAVPRPIKQLRQGKQYLVIGLRLNRDTERMILTDMIVDAGAPAGWALIPDPTAKTRRYCATKGIEIIPCGVNELLAAAGCPA